jgi:hypothetical protein
MMEMVSACETYFITIETPNREGAFLLSKKPSYYIDNTFSVISRDGDRCSILVYNI